MVLKLKEYGKYVIGVGIRESASDILIQNCDEYYSYSDLAGLAKEAEAPPPRDPWELVVDAVQRMVADNDVMRSDRLKQVMQQIDPAFDERDAGFNRFSKFVTEAGHRGLITVIKQENGQFDVAPAGPDSARRPSGRGGSRAAAPAAAPVPAPRAAEPEAEPKPGRSRRGRRGRGRGSEVAAPAPATPGGGGHEGLTLAEAFHLLTRALGELPTPVAHETLRARMAAIHGREDSLLDTDRFSKLLRQANDAEVADVRLLADNSFEVSPHKADLALKVRPLGEAPEGAPAPRPATALRFRGGSRSGTKPPELSMVGVVDLGGDGASAPEPAEPAAEQPANAVLAGTPGDSATDAGDDAPKESKPRRGRRGGRGRGKKAAAGSAGSEVSAPKATPAGSEEKPKSRRRNSRKRAG
jgi:hypothetical protein